MKKKLISILLASVLCVSMILPVSASSTGVEAIAEGSDVYAGVIVDADGDDAKIRVTVPTIFAFVANGSATENTDALTVEDGYILIPNYTVEVANSDEEYGDYSLEVTGSSAFKFSNYSTKKDDTKNSGRVGIPVTIKGYIENEGSAFSRNYWEHVSSVTPGDTSQFKKYLLSIDEKEFNQTDGSGKFFMEDSVELPVPPATESGAVDSNFLAKVPAIKDVEFSVEIGGQRDQYNQVEKSAKVGTIVWTASYEFENDDSIPTAPSNPYLPGSETP